MLAVSMACGAVLCALPTDASARSPKQRDALKVLKLSGASDIGDQGVEQLIAAFRSSATDVPDAYWAKLKKRLDPRDLLDDLANVYARHLSHADIKALIKFYKSPVGRRFVKLQPTIMGESMQVGQRWGQKVSAKVAAEIQKMQDKKGKKK